MRNLYCIVLSVLFFFIPIAAFAGNLDDPAAPTSADSAMYTLEDIYNRLDSNTQATKRSGAFTEPSAAPGSTGHTLDEVYEKAIPTQVEKTGQTTSQSTGDDGNLTMGVAWPNPRFTDNSNGTVTDNLTGLIWLKNANAFGLRNWATALTDCNTLNSGEHGLSDGSVEGDWRLPNVKELQSLIDWAYYGPALSNAAGTAKWTSGDVFSGVQSDFYWSSTTYANFTTYAWRVDFDDGCVDGMRVDDSYVWPVRGGQ